VVKRIVAAFLAAMIVLTGVDPAVSRGARAEGPFPIVPLSGPERQPHAGAYASLLVGAGLVGGSFAISRRADDVYRDYLAATEPARITRLYDEAVRDDRLASAALLTGEALIAFGVYLRFIHRSGPRTLGLTAAADRCAVSLSF
jgi:hypothetical protein